MRTADICYHVWETPSDGFESNKIVVIKYFKVSDHFSVLTMNRYNKILFAESSVSVDELELEVLERLCYPLTFSYKAINSAAIVRPIHEATIDSFLNDVLNSIVEFSFKAKPVVTAEAIAKEYSDMGSGIDMGRDSGKSIVSLRDHTGSMIGRVPISLPTMVDAPDMIEAYMESMRKAIGERTDKDILRSKK